MRGIALLLLALVLAACAGAGAAATAPAPDGPSAPPGMAVVTVAELPTVAARTLALIEAGGPFPYRQDDATFQNREGLLPAADEGYYREFTVPTPGEDDRGARRIVTGASGERYWTADHYDSFAWIDP